jgi:hypothetical protein
MSECQPTTFIQTNEAFLLTIVATLSGMFGLLLNTCIKSRCTAIKFCGLECIRNPIPVEELNNVNIENNQNNNNNNI